MIGLYTPRPSVREEPDRVHLSAGICSPESGSDAGPPYVTTARIPAGPWRQPSPRERRDLWLAQWPKDRAAVGVVSLPGFKRLRVIRESCGRFDRSYADAVDAAARNLLRRATDARSKGEPTLTGIAEHLPGLVTLTVGAEGKRVGLHVDTWEPWSVEERQLAAGRLCVNVGRVDRWFLFVPLTLQEIAAQLAAAGIATAELGVNSLADAYLRTFPSQPVVRLRLGPGEAYIAPTDNLIHDGSSLGSDRNNLCYTYRGHFAIRAAAPRRSG